MYLFWSFKNGKKAPRNPWGGSTLEWQAPTPPTLYNFEKPPVLHEIYNYDDFVEVAGRHLGAAELAGRVRGVEEAIGCGCGEGARARSEGETAGREALD